MTLAPISIMYVRLDPANALKYSARRCPIDRLAAGFWTTQLCQCAQRQRPPMFCLCATQIYLAHSCYPSTASLSSKYMDTQADVPLCQFSPLTRRLDPLLQSGALQVSTSKPRSPNPRHLGRRACVLFRVRRCRRRPQVSVDRSQSPKLERSRPQNH